MPEERTCCGPMMLMRSMHFQTAWFTAVPSAPVSQVRPTSWLTEAWPVVANAYAMRDLGGQPLRFEGRRKTPFGANFVVRTPEQRAIRYNPELGRKPSGGLDGKETEVVSKLLGLGHEGWWVPGATVVHHVPLERMTTSYVCGHFRNYGASLGRRQVPRAGPTLFGRPLGVWRQAITSEAYRLPTRFPAGSLGEPPVQCEHRVGPALWTKASRLSPAIDSLQPRRRCHRRLKLGQRGTVEGRPPRERGGECR
jgi:hypothetical protein